MALSAEYGAWLPESTIDALSKSLGESEAVREARRRSHRSFLELPMEPNPLYRKYGYFAGVDLSGLDPVAKGPAVSAPPLLPNSVQVLHDASGTRIQVAPDLAAAGVVAAPWRGGESVGAEAETPEDRLLALGSATRNRGFTLQVPDRCPRPVRLQEISVLSRKHEALSVRRTLTVGAGSHVLASEEVYSTPVADPGAQRLYASDTRLTVGDEARAALLTFHAPDPRTVSVYARQATALARARAAWVWAGFGGMRTRIRNRTYLAGNGSDVTDLQAYFGVGDQAYDSAVDLVHQGTDTHGQSISRGVFRDTSRGMSRGLVRIEKEARKTLSFLSEHAMLLSKGARSDTIPVLEILCRDVKATHSSSVAPVDPERVFYLESRGIEKDTAVRMIAEGFLSHVFERAPIPGLRELAYPLLDARWDGRAVEWREESIPALPPIELSGAIGETDWRFDAKLR